MAAMPEPAKLGQKALEAPGVTCADGAAHFAVAPDHTALSQGSECEGSQLRRRFWAWAVQGRRRGRVPQMRQMRTGAGRTMLIRLAGLYVQLAGVGMRHLVRGLLRPRLVPRLEQILLARRSGRPR